MNVFNFNTANINEIELSDFGHIFFNKPSHDLFFDSDEEIEQQAPKKKSKFDFYNNVVIENFNSKQFKKHFQMNYVTFSKILRDIKILEPKFIQRKVGRPCIPIEKQLLLTIWYFSSLEFFSSIAKRFAISDKACWFVVVNISKLILKLCKKKEIISWPSRLSMKKTAKHFLLADDFPGVVACIDGSHIAIPAPKVYPSSYMNNKNFHSVVLQGVCDENLLFLDCYAGELGSISPSCLLQRSNLYERLNNGSLNISKDQHLVGGLGYDLKMHLITPFINKGHSSLSNRLFNQKHISVHSTIGKAFGLLKARFSRLQRLSTKKPALIPLFITVGCILHNICIKSQDFYEDSYEIDKETLSEMRTKDNTRINQNDTSREAFEKRKKIAKFILRRNLKQN